MNDKSKEPAEPGLPGDSLREVATWFFQYLTSLDESLGRIMRFMNLSFLAEHETTLRQLNRFAVTPADFPQTPHFNDILAAADKGQELERITKEVGKKIRDMEVSEVHVTQENSSVVFGLAERLTRLAAPTEIVERSLFCSLTAYFDGFLRELLLAAIRAKPDILKPLAGDAEITYSELMSAGAINDVNAFVAEKVVDSLSRESYAKLFNSLSKTLAWDVAPSGRLASLFEEITERRHLFTHCDGKVSRSYMRRMKSLGLDEQSPRLGEQLNIGAKYFRRAIDVFFVVGVKCVQVVGRKLFGDRDECSACDNELIQGQFIALKAGRWWRAAALGELAEQDSVVKKTIGNDRIRRMLLINRAQALKWAGKQDECKKLLQEHDWSSVGNAFMLAVAVLQDDWDAACNAMKRVGVSEEVRKASYVEWPLFREFRKTKEFAAAFQSVFGESFEAAASRIVGSETRQANADAHIAMDAVARSQSQG